MHSITPPDEEKVATVATQSVLPPLGIAVIGRFFLDQNNDRFLDTY